MKVIFSFFPLLVIYLLFTLNCYLLLLLSLMSEYTFLGSISSTLILLVLTLFAFLDHLDLLAQHHWHLTLITALSLIIAIILAFNWT